MWSGVVSAAFFVTLHHDNNNYALGVFRRALCRKQGNRTEGNKQHFLPGRPTFAMVHGSVRHGWGIHIWRHLRVCSGHGHNVWHDLPSDMPRVHTRLLHRGIHTVAALLPAQPDHDIFISRIAHRQDGLQDRGLVFPAFKNSGCLVAVLCGMSHRPGVRVRRLWHTILCHGIVHGGPDMAVHTPRRHQDPGLDRLVPDRLPFHVTNAYHRQCCLVNGHEHGRGGTLSDPRPHEPHICV